MKISIACALLLVACGSGDPATTPAAPGATAVSSTTTKVASDGARLRTPSGEAIALEVASTPAARARGLMFRDHLPRGRGMIFVFPNEEIQGFWMKNTLISLDMIWMDSDGTIVHIEEQVPPCVADPCPSYASTQKAKYVLELAGGEVAHFDLQPGERLSLEGLDSYRVE